MNIAKKINIKAQDLKEKDPVTIAFFGDSVTQGCFELYKTGEKSFETVYDSGSAYCTKVREILALLYPNVPVNIIRAGIDGGNTGAAVKRIERDVIRFKPDLTVVCFGLNDCTGGIEKIGNFTDNLTVIFEKLENGGSEIIYMTPNTMNTQVSCHISDEYVKSVAAKFMGVQNSGILKKYTEAAKELCLKKSITVCDVYSIWEKMLENGIDVTNLLSNYINHPKRELHWLFAYELVKTMLY